VPGKGILLDAEQVVRRLLDALHKCVAVQGFLFQKSQHHHLEGAGKEISGFELRHGNAGRGMTEDWSR
jgi:hypothetical protein